MKENWIGNKGSWIGNEWNMTRDTLYRTYPATLNPPFSTKLRPPLQKSAQDGEAASQPALRQKETKRNQSHPKKHALCCTQTRRILQFQHWIRQTVHLFAPSACKRHAIVNLRNLQTCRFEGFSWTFCSNMYFVGWLRIRTSSFDAFNIGHIADAFCLKVKKCRCTSETGQHWTNLVELGFSASATFSMNIQQPSGTSIFILFWSLWILWYTLLFLHIFAISMLSGCMVFDYFPDCTWDNAS